MLAPITMMYCAQSLALDRDPYPRSLFEDSRLAICEAHKLGARIYFDEGADM